MLKISTMRLARPLLLLGILAMVAGIGSMYYARLRLQAEHSPRKPPSLPPGISAAAQDWVYTKRIDNRPIVSVRAKQFQEVDGKNELGGVELHLFNKDATKYDLVKCATAEFKTNEKSLYSDGEVEITMGVPADQQPTGRLMTIRSSGVHFDTQTGKAFTDRPASFEFTQGDGKAVGAQYDPKTRELQLHGNVVLMWRGLKHDAPPMRIEAADVIYKEAESKVYLSPWSKFQRQTLTMNGGIAVVTLKEGVIQAVYAATANGTDIREDRNVQYAADNLDVGFDEDGYINKMVGQPNAHLVSATDSGTTTISTDRIDMDFDTTTGDSILKTALASGHSVVESKPTVQPGADTPETRILRSENVITKMRAGGKEIDSVETPTPGSLEFLPNRPEQAHRTMTGDHLWITYGAQNTIDTFRSVSVTTRTDNPKPKDAKKTPAPVLTWSKDLLAHFEPKTSKLATLEQTNDFRYESGDRKATADRATLDQAKNLIHLIGRARMSDANGIASADQIFMDQKSGDFTAEGGVKSTHMPDKKSDTDNPGMLSEDEPLHALAKKMISTADNTDIRYEGDAVLWQEANRLQADVVEINRDDNTVKANGHVISELMDKDKNKDKDKDAPSRNPKAAPDTPIFTVVHAPEMIYTDNDRLAYYKGGATLERPDLSIKGKEIRAWLKPEDKKKKTDPPKKEPAPAAADADENNSSLDHAFADGEVHIDSVSQGRTRVCTSDHAEYYVAEDKVVLRGGQPQVVDSLKGTTRGYQLTWYSKQDRLVVTGDPKIPAKSNLKRKAHPAIT